MIELCIDSGHVSLNKSGEQLCGDHVETARGEDGSTIVVLADGMGSGVKANILSILTSKIISTMMANSIGVEECISTIASALPVCKERQMAYSTFTVIRISPDLEAELIQYDNPKVVMLREGKNYEYPVISEQIGGKTIYKSKLRLLENDVLLAFSDGAIHASMGSTLNLGWQRDEIIDYMQTMYCDEFTAKTLSAILLGECSSLYGGEPGDDTTVCAVKIRRRRAVNLLIGPPADPKDVGKMMMFFFAKEGKHIVCGGTTSKLAADYLRKPLDLSQPQYIVPDIPPTSKIEGVDLVTEGVITMTRVLDYARDYLKNNEKYETWCYSRDGASLISQMLFEEATDISFFVGKAINPAHQNDELPIGFSAKMKLVEDLSDCLSKMGKNIKVSYF